MKHKKIQTERLPHIKHLKKIDPSELVEGQYYFNVWLNKATRKVFFEEHQRKDLKRIPVYIDK
jgi:hypothetical protein